MTGRRRTPVDLAAVKKSRGGFIGAVTKVLDKLKAMPCDEPEEIAVLNTKEIDRLIASLIRTETGFLQTVEDTQGFSPGGEDEDEFQAEEEATIDNFQSAISSARDLGERLLTLKAVLTGIADFKSEEQIIKDALSVDPGSAQKEAVQLLRTSLSTLKAQWTGADLPSIHSLQNELKACARSLNGLAADILAEERTSATTSSTSTTSPCCGSVRQHDLPSIDVPQFNGEILQWSTFWATFKSTIEDRKDLTNTQRLQYLRKAIKDPDTAALLTSPIESPDMYLEVVQLLKSRFNKTREIHRHIIKNIISTTTPKQTRLELRRLADAARRNIDSLKATKQYDVESVLTSFYYLILPSKLQMLWDQHTKHSKGIPPISQLLTFITDYAETLTFSQNTPVERQDPGPKKPPFKKRDHYQKAKAPVHVVAPTTSYKWECSLCKPEKHPLHVCPKWSAFNMQQKLGHIQAKSLCSNCLAGGHATSACKSSYRCRECSQMHHTSIHQVPPPSPVNYSASMSSELPDALMTTAQLLLTGPNGQTMKARALIDSGAGLSLISKRVTQQLDLPLESINLQLTAVQGEFSKPTKHVTSVHISPLHNPTKKMLCRPAVSQQVTSDLPPQAIQPVGDLPHILGLQLADPDYAVPGRIDLLLGADMAPKIMVKELLRHGTDAQPIAQATEFGWVISGPTVRKHPSTSKAPVPTNHQSQTAEEPQLDNLIKSFWDSEEAEEVQPAQSQLEQQVENHYSNTTIYSPAEKRYQVTLPKNSEIDSLGESRTQAHSRYLSNEQSIIRRGIWTQFQEVIQQYLDLGHAEPVPPEAEAPARQFYLPMHAVFKESSSSTKIRVVFDGSAVTTSGRSLNNTLLVGPQLQPTLGNILMRFRTYPVALNGDISKMYREVELTPSDRDLHRFLWRPSPELAVQTYRMTRVTFGVSASPYLAIRTLQRTAEDHGEEYPNVTHHVRESFYVDDFLGGAATPSEALQLLTDMRKVLQKGGFNICKWRSNSADVLRHLPSQLLEPSLVKKDTAPHSVTHSKALGLEWDSAIDVMSPSINISSTYRTTKRGIIADVSRTYDILGWIAPTILLMKILYQQLWKKGHGWDEQVSAKDLELHLKWRTALPLLTNKTLPRCYSTHPQTKIHQELHGFSDASLQAYGAVVYCRTTYSDRPPEVSLVTAKTKVAKLKPTTVPRLELEAAVLLTKLLVNAGRVLEISSEDWHAWTDSSIVLCWLSGQPTDWKVFVTNRVSFIMQATSPNTWMHVPTGENPADCASRGMMPEELLKYQLWWSGPDWLAMEPVTIPHQPAKGMLVVPEQRPVHALVPTSSVATEIIKLSSNYFTILAITAWVLRFCQRIKRGQPSPEQKTRLLTRDEISAAEKWLLREAQKRAYPRERGALLKGDQIPSSSPLRALAPFLDEEGLLRVGGRLQHSSLSKFQRHPIIANSKDELTITYVAHMHVSLCHCGPSLLLCHTGIKLHIVGARRLTRKICSSCITCRKNSPSPQPQLMGQLPAPRVNPTAAFTHTGMDFAGPFELKLGHTRRPVKVKAYICVFICLTYKAVHLEVVSDLTTPAFRACLDRFVSRRNTPQHLYSDNGSNFLGARNDLLELQRFLQLQTEDPEIQHYLPSHHRIEWHTIPQRSPHFGGLWESAVRSMKKHLKRIMGSTPLSFEEMTTVVCQVESCLNSHPLLPITAHNQDGYNLSLLVIFCCFNSHPLFHPIQDCQTTYLFSEGGISAVLSSNSSGNVGL